MIAAARCQLIGRWRIFEANLWDLDYLDLVEPAYLTITKNGRGEFAFGAINATMELECSRSIVFFRWTGSDEGDEVSGEGSAELQDDGTVEIELSFDAGDDAIEPYRVSRRPQTLRGWGHGEAEVIGTVFA